MKIIKCPELEEKIITCQNCSTTFSYEKRELSKIQVPNLFAIYKVTCPHCGKEIFIDGYVFIKEWEKVFNIPFTKVPSMKKFFETFTNIKITKGDK